MVHTFMVVEPEAGPKSESRRLPTELNGHSQFKSSQESEYFKIGMG